MAHYENRTQDPEIIQFSDSDLRPEMAPPRLAFCFLTVQPIENQLAWVAFFNACDRLSLSYVVIYHAKANRLFDHPFKAIQARSVTTSWAETVNAHISLIESAQAANADKAIILSEWCLPLKSPADLYASLKHPYTLLTNATLKNHKNSHGIPNDSWRVWVKHEQWVIIDKAHFACYLPNEGNAFLLKDLIKIHYGNEFSAHAFIRQAGKAHEIRNANAWRVSWAKNDVHPTMMVLSTEFLNPNNKDVQRHPLKSNMGSITPETIIHLATKQKYLFARKFHKSTQTPELLHYLSGGKYSPESELVDIAALPHIRISRLQIA